MKWSERRVPPPFGPAPEAGASLLGYALVNSPSALDPAPGHYLDHAGSPLAHRVQLGEMVEHQGIAPCIPVWKTGVYLSTLMLEEMESRAGVTPA